MNKKTTTMSFPRKRESRFSLSLLFHVIASVAKQSLLMSLRGHIVSRLPGVCRVAIFLFSTLPSFALAEEKIPIFPTSPIDAYTVYATLALLWLGIIGLIVITKMKLNEIERIQKLGVNKEDIDVPILE